MTNAHSVGVAVIGGGMAGHAPAAGFRTASTLFSTDRPDVRLVAIANVICAPAGDTAAANTATKRGRQLARSRR